MDRFLIAPLNSGLDQSAKPWLTPENSFAELTNAYVYRSRVKKRPGSAYSGLTALNSRLRCNVGTTNAGGLITGQIYSDGFGKVFKKGQQFSIGTVVFTVATDGAGVQTLLRTDGSAEPATYDTTLYSGGGLGAYTLAASAFPNTACYFYPSESVMGLTQFSEGNATNKPAYAFDTQFAYKFTTSWEVVGPTTQFNGSDSDFFWSTNWTGLDGKKVLFTSNFHVVNPNGAVDPTDDPIWTYDGTTWLPFQPYFKPAGGHHNTGPKVITARIVLPFKNRLILLRPIETNTAGTLNQDMGNRCRYSHNGSPFTNNAFYEPNQRDDDSAPAPAARLSDGGGWVDAATDENIVSAEYIKDRLIVHFDRSSWELAYTGNPIIPFVWQKLNTELGSLSPFSTVPFDKHVLTVGQTGILACNGVNVERIDELIPDVVFELKDRATSAVRVCGIRDYYTEIVYWAFPPSNNSANLRYPNRLLLYNYKNNTWAWADDCVTAFGYFEQQVGRTWANTGLKWRECNFSWRSGTIKPQARTVIAGNQHGYVFKMDPGLTTNAPVLQLSKIVPAAIASFLYLTVADHNLSDGDYIKLVDDTDSSNLDGLIVKALVIDKDTLQIDIGDPTAYSGHYYGGANIARVSKISIKSKQWNPYIKEARKFLLDQIEFAVDKTSYGQVTVDAYTDTSNLSLIEESQNTNCDVGNNVLETSPYPDNNMEKASEMLWHNMYIGGEGKFVQIHITMSDEQMRTPPIVESDFTLQGLVLHTCKTSDNLS